MIQRIISICFRGIRRIKSECNIYFSKWYCHLVFYCLCVKHSDFKTSGTPFISVSKNGGVIKIGKNFSMHNGMRGNPIGPNEKCMLIVGKNASLTIGDNVGMSQTAIVCHNKIIIGNNVKIGGGVQVYDTDFHSLNPKLRRDPLLDVMNTNRKPVVLKNNSFIGAHSTILKGVTIGENAIIGACSVVSKNIPDNEIWGGNPAKFIKLLKQ